MLKKLMLLAMTVGALVAFAAPAVAQAEIELTNAQEETHEGTVAASSENLVITFGLNFVSCNSVAFDYSVVTNGPEFLSLSSLWEAETSGCGLTVGGIGTFPAVITDWTTFQIDLDTWGKDHFVFTEFTVHVPAAGLSCGYLGNLIIEGNGEGSDSLDVETALVFLEEGGGAGCATLADVHGDLTLNDFGPLTLDYEETP